MRAQRVLWAWVRAFGPPTTRRIIRVQTNQYRSSNQPINQENNPMKKIISSLVPAAAIALLAVGAQAQTSGYTQYSSSFTVQNRTSGCGSFHSGGGVYTCTVCAGEERVEMRWQN